MTKVFEKRTQSGFTLISLMAALSILGIMFSYGIATFLDNGIDCKNKDHRPGFVTRARIAGAIAEIGGVNLLIQRFSLSHNRLPEDGELDLGLDPWGNPYVFLSFADINGNGPKRKNRNMVPVNSYFDIYSMGPDGQTATPFTSIPGGDDIVIANNGQYVGVACYYYKK